MPRHPRVDGPDTWHHVMNRGMAKRTAFEDDLDIRFFLSRLARAVRAGWIEVHSYAVLSTHFHLLVRSRASGLSAAMQWILNAYVRRFNRGRRRDGSLFRGRFASKPVSSLSYRRQLVRYIDFNPVEAGLVPTPALYPHGSARWYARPSRPPWLSRDWIEETVRAQRGSSVYDPLSYPDCFGQSLSPGLAKVVERRMQLPARTRDPLDDLLGAAPEAVLAWMRRKAALADGTSIDQPVCDPEAVRSSVAAARESDLAWQVATSQRPSPGWPVVEVALLRDFCGITWSEIALRLGTSIPTALKTYARHRQLLVSDAQYARIAAEHAAAAIDASFGARRPLSEAPRDGGPPRLPARFGC
jgi:hypothetical protein